MPGGVIAVQVAPTSVDRTSPSASNCDQIVLSDSGVHGFTCHSTAHDVGKETAKPVWRELVGGRLDFVNSPPAVLAHEVALEIIPTADIDLVLIDADEIKALPLTRGLARVRHRKHVFSHPDQGTDVSRLESAFFG